MLRVAGHRVALFDPLFFNDREVLARRYDFVTCTEVVEFHSRSVGGNSSSQVIS